MKFSLVKWLGTIFLLSIITFSCQKSDTSLDDSSIEIDQLQLEKDFSQDTDVPFRKYAKQNPYEISNMRKAYTELNGGAKNALALKVSHYYVRFWVETPDISNELEKQEIVLEKYPLDLDVTEEVQELINDITHNEEGSWYYAAVPNNFEFNPRIQYQVLDELYIPDTATKNSGKELDFEIQLENKAFELVGDPIKTKDLAKANVQPTGYVRVLNTITNNQDPVVGVTVRARRWFTYSYGVTNTSGFYRIYRKFRRDVNLSVFFRNSKGFEVWSAVVNVGEAQYELGKHSNRGTSITFFTNSKGWRFSTVNNATVDYMNECTQLGISQPPSGLRIIAQSRGSGAAGAPLFRQVNGVYGFATSKLVKYLNYINPLFIFTSAVLNQYGPDIITPSAGTMGTGAVSYLCFHELAHASHLSRAGGRYWVDYINYIATYGAYGNGTGYNAGVAGIGEQWGNYYGDQVLRSVHSLQNFNPGEDWFNPGFLRDSRNLTGDISLSEMFSCLTPTTRTFDILKSQLKTKNR